MESIADHDKMRINKWLMDVWDLETFQICIRLGSLLEFYTAPYNVETRNSWLRYGPRGYMIYISWHPRRSAIVYKHTSIALLYIGTGEKEMMAEDKDDGDSYRNGWGVGAED